MILTFPTFFAGSSHNMHMAWHSSCFLGLIWLWISFDGWVINYLLYLLYHHTLAPLDYYRVGDFSQFNMDIVFGQSGLFGLVSWYVLCYLCCRYMGIYLFQNDDQCMIDPPLEIWRYVVQINTRFPDLTFIHLVVWAYIWYVTTHNGFLFNILGLEFLIYALFGIPDLRYTWSLILCRHLFWTIWKFERLKVW